MVSEIQRYQNALADAREMLNEWKALALKLVANNPELILVRRSGQEDYPCVWEVRRDNDSGFLDLWEWVGRSGYYRGAVCAEWFAPGSERCNHVPPEVTKHIQEKYLGIECP